MNTGLTTFFSKDRLPYTGPELRPHFLYENFQLRGSGIAGWRGPCSVSTAHMVDWEDRVDAETIAAVEMVHFLGEFFGPSLTEAILFQRLWIARIGAALGPAVTVKGDDLYFSGRKMSVSIATASPVSSLLHLGINVDGTGAPVKTSDLLEVPGLVSIDEFAARALELAAQEWNEIAWARAKVRAV